MTALNTIAVDVSKQNSIIHYPILGDILIEIQGDLEIDRPGEKDFSKEFRFGELEFSLHINEELLELATKELQVEKSELDMEALGRLSGDLKEKICKSNDKKECTIYVGSKQRLLGKFLKLPLPLAILEMHGKENLAVRKVVKYKFQFVDRPLPIM